MTQPSGAPSLTRLTGDDVKTLVGAFTENAHRLGLKWLVRPGTIVNGSDPANVSVKVDGDDVATMGVTSMIGSISAKLRVYLLIIPSVGTYVIGHVGHAPTSGQQISDPSIRTTNVGPFTAETQTDEIKVVLPVPGVYRVIFDGQVQSDVANGAARGRIREDSSSGTQIQLRQTPTNALVNQSFALRMETRYRATSAKEKTFVVTVARQGGTGNYTATASSDVPTFLYVEYVSS